MTTPAKEGTSLVKKETLVEKFQFISGKITVLEKASLSVKIENNDQLAVAENNATEAQKYLKEVESIRKALKDPYLATVKAIDGYAGVFKDSLERIKMRFNAQITTFRSIEQARLEAERKAKLEEANKLEAEKRNETALIARVQERLIAMIYGGTYTTKDGKTHSDSGCFTSSQCDDVLKVIETQVPPVTSFKYFATTYEDMLLGVKTKLAEHRQNIIDLSNREGLISKEAVAKKITEARIEAIQDHQDTVKSTNKIIEKETKKEEKAIDNEIKDAGKGIRKVLVWKVVDEDLVPRDLLSVDSVKVNQYLNDHKDNIKSAIQEGKDEILPGIKFYIDAQHIAR